ncbi:jg25225 [Pararge aegeria aegeria]|uniref:Jg25225 protein n=1 Tax=Pararge aegeria aegeria TaxID=348720 RepID=A0A8S4RUW5_9NEOP|nr:jg25225 [Pararge aegeria aegeria]
MEDDTTKETEKKEEKPTTSKIGMKKNNKTTGNRDKSNERDNRDGQETSSDESDNSTYTMDSNNEPIANNNEAKMVPLGDTVKIGTNRRGKKKRTTKKTIAGKVEKKKRPAPRRHVIRRAPKRRVQLPREISRSTIFTRLSSSGTIATNCHHCGHRCCRRRFEYELILRFCEKCRHKVRNYYGYKRKSGRKLRVIKAPINMLTRSEAIQTGSRSYMLSPLYITSNSAPVENIDFLSQTHGEITPEMIQESLRRLTMWRQAVPTSSILDYLSQHYPVNNDKDALLVELLNKLKVCVMIGTVCQSPEGTWSLSCKLEDRKLKKNHVTLFWKLYCDTLKPIKMEANNNQQKAITNDQATAKRNTLTIYDEDII